LVSFTLISFNTDGSVNENFGDSGIVLTSFTPFEDFGMDFCLDRFNRVVFAGQAVQGISSNPGIAVARYYSDLYTGLPDKDNHILSDNPYPNPASEEINLHLRNAAGLVTTVDLLDMSGKQVCRLYPGVGANHAQGHLNFRISSQVTPGFYILHIANNNRSEFYKIIIHSSSGR
jgi:hypothetical protein